MKDLIIQKIKDRISALEDAAADALITSHVPANATLAQLTQLLSKIQEGTIDL